MEEKHMSIIKIIFDRYNRPSYIVTGKAGGINAKKSFVEYCITSSPTELRVANVTDGWKNLEHRENMLKTLKGKEEISTFRPETYKDKVIPGIKPLKDGDTVKGIVFYMNMNLDINFISKETSINFEHDITESALASNMPSEWCPKSIANSYKNQFYLDWLMAYVYSMLKEVTPFEKIKDGDKCTVLAMIRSLDSWTFNTMGKPLYNPKYYVVRVNNDKKIVLLNSAIVRKMRLELEYDTNAKEVLIPWSIVDMKTELDSDNSQIIKYSLDPYKLMLLTYGKDPAAYIVDVYNRLYKSLVTKSNVIDRGDGSYWNPDFNFKFWCVGRNKQIAEFLDALGMFACTARRRVEALEKTEQPEQVEQTKNNENTTTDNGNTNIPSVTYAEAFDVKNGNFMMQCATLSIAKLESICSPTSEFEILTKYKTLNGKATRVIGFDVVDLSNKKKYRLAYTSVTKMLDAGIINVLLGSFSKKDRPQIVTQTTDIIIKPTDPTKFEFLYLEGDFEKMARAISEDRKKNGKRVYTNTEVKTETKEVAKENKEMSTTDIVNNMGAPEDVVNELVGYSKASIVHDTTVEALRKYGNLKTRGINIKLINKVSNSSGVPVGYTVKSCGRTFYISLKTALEMTCLGVVEGAIAKGIGKSAYVDPENTIDNVSVKSLRGTKTGTTEAFKEVEISGEKMIKAIIRIMAKNNVPQGTVMQPTTPQETKAPVNSGNDNEFTTADISANTNLVAEFNYANNEYTILAREREYLLRELASKRQELAKLEAKIAEHDTKMQESKKRLAMAHANLTKSFKC